VSCLSKQCLCDTSNILITNAIRMLEISKFINLEDSVLLIVDPQVAFGTAVPVPNVSTALVNIQKAAELWRSKGGRVFLTKHVFANPLEVGRVADFLGEGIYEALRTDSPLAEFYPDLFLPEDIIIKKTRFNALEGTNLESQLRALNIEKVVVCGLTTPICVGTTVDALTMKDFKVFLLEDACASQAMGELNAFEAHRAAVERMRYLFAEILATNEFTTRVTAL
jgi:nicotinamidase-related amidase